MHNNLPPTRSRGFTLVESIIVLVLLSIAAASIATLSGNIFHGEDDNRDLQTGIKLMQECAEQVLATRRATADFSNFTPACPSGTLPAFSGFSVPAVTTTSPYTGTGCPAGAQCKLVTISVNTPGGDTLPPLTLLLVGS
ncbi:MAG: type II secretion system protein [Rhodocyclaceae bacterium]|nr:type II secretion system protein [Rhodocyclaceae bacterium]MDZ4215089.1 type II secretion system protein [Rhodocyclaceae bacterium]